MAGTTIMQVPWLIHFAISTILKLAAQIRHIHLLCTHQPIHLQIFYLFIYLVIHTGALRSLNNSSTALS